jgi:hypothetical protein
MALDTARAGAQFTCFTSASTKVQIVTQEARAAVASGAATELQQICIRDASELQQSCNRAAIVTQEARAAVASGAAVSGEGGRERERRRAMAARRRAMPYCCNRAATELQQRYGGEEARYAIVLQQSCNRAATELQQRYGGEEASCVCSRMLTYAC